MENPTFRLEGVIKAKDDMEDFEGPLALILLLLSKNKIEIRDIQISVILEQYLDYLKEMESMDLEIASEFVAMASHLVYIKTKTLLSGAEEVSEIEALISSLEELQSKECFARVKSAVDKLRELETRGIDCFSKPPEYIAPDKEYKYDHGKQELAEALVGLLKRSEGTAAFPAVFAIPSKITYPVSDKAREIVERLQGSGNASLWDIFMDSRSRSELVATFIAVLELCGKGAVYLIGTDEEITISMGAYAYGNS